MDVTRQQLLRLIPRLANRVVLVIGDLFLDEYVIGQATRLSREAPIPVLEFVRQFHIPGGAANPARNIRALGGRATVVGLVGEDEAGAALLSELRDAGVDPAGVVVDGSRPTTTKTRIVAEGTLRFPQQIARIDRIKRQPIGGEIEDMLIQQIEQLVPKVDAVLVSDYQAGVATPAIVSAALSSTRAQGKLRAVDTQGAFFKYAGFDLIKGNRHEIGAALACPLVKDEDYHKAGARLLDELGANVVLITRGAEGLSLVARDGGYHHLPAANRTEVFDVTGAGDTVIAVSTLALLADASAVAAARLANYAAGLVVRKLGNAVATAEELAWAVSNW